MSLSFAGVTLSDGTESPFPGLIDSWAEWVQNNIRAQNIFPLSINAWNGVSQFGGYGPDMPVRPYTLYWPVGATRWAHFHCFVSERELGLIRQAAPAGSGTLEMSWSDKDNILVDQITPTLTALSAKPLDQLTLGVANVDGFTSEGLYLLTLVDDRFFWWLRQTPAIGESSSTFTWAQVLSSLATNLGITITSDAVAGAYSNPTVNINDIVEFAPAAMDVACFYTGHRLTRSLTGAVKTRTPTNALTDATANTKLAADRSPKGGGAFNRPDLHWTLPSVVKVLFPRNDNDQFYEVVTTSGPPGATAGPTLVPLSVAPLTGITGNGKTKDLVTTYPADFIGGSPSNQSTLDTITAQMASDYYNWMVLQYDWKVTGIASMTPDAFHDIEWIYRNAEVSTRLIPYKYEVLFFAKCCRSLIKTTVLTSGSSTFTSTSSTRKIKFRLWGAGGGGGGVPAGGASQYGMAAGGGSGSPADKTVDDPGNTSYPYSVGTAGTGGVGNANGGNGGNTTVTLPSGTVVTAPGGKGGEKGVPNTDSMYSLGGDGGAVATNGDVNGTGNPGGQGWFLNTSSLGGSIPLIYWSGIGGCTSMGGGGNTVSAQSNGKAGTNGGGGSGAGMVNGGAATNGGAGGSGLIIIDEFN